MTFDPMQMNPYEHEALAQIREWSRRGPTASDRVLRLAMKPIDKTFDLALSSDWARARFESGMESLVTSLNEQVTKSLPTDPVLARYRKLGVDLDRFEDIPVIVDLHTADLATANLKKKYMSGLVVEGAAAGASSLAGPGAALAAMVVDVPTVLTGLLRAVADHGRHYGFDPNEPRERYFTMQTLTLASEVTDTGRTAGLFSLYRIAQDLARRASMNELEQHALVRVIVSSGERLGVRMTQRKVGQLLPVVGAAMGAGFNAYYTGRVIEAASNLNRARFIARRHGIDIEALIDADKMPDISKRAGSPDASGKLPPPAA